MSATDNNNYDDEVEELKTHLALDEDAALERIEEQKGELRSILDRMQGLMEDAKVAGSEGAGSVKRHLDELRLQLALGKMETRDRLDEQREKIAHAVAGAKKGLGEIGEKADDKWGDVTASLNAQWQKLRPRLDALKLNMALGAAYAGDELDRRKEQVATKLGEWKTKIQEEKEPIREAVEEFGEELKEAGAELVAGLKAFFRRDDEEGGADTGDKSGSS